MNQPQAKSEINNLLVNRAEDDEQVKNKKHDQAGSGIIADVCYVKQGSSLFMTNSADLVVLERIPTGTYTLMYHPEKGFYLEPSAALVVPEKLYGSTQLHCDRFLTAFAARNENTGILLTGDKGSGKSLLGCVMSRELLKADVITILINAPYMGDAFNSFIASIKQPCMLYFDEFEKVYDASKGEQEGLLTLMAGVYSGKKLFVLTSNQTGRALDSHLLNRPGRIFYHVKFHGVTMEMVTQYSNEHLVNKAHQSGLQLLASQIGGFNFDMLKSLVEEMNRFGEPAREAVQLMNIRPDSNDYISYDGAMFKKGEPMPDAYVACSNPLNNGVQVRWKTGKTDKDGDMIWESLNFTPSHIAKVDMEQGTITFARDKFTVELRRRYANYDFHAYDAS